MKEKKVCGMNLWLWFHIIQYGGEFYCSIFVKQSTVIQRELIYRKQQMEKFPPLLGFKKNWKSPSPRYAYSSNKFLCDRSNLLKWTIFLGNRPAALGTSREVKRGRKEWLIFSVLFCNFISSHSTLHLCTHFIYRLLVSEKWRQR